MSTEIGSAYAVCEDLMGRGDVGPALGKAVGPLLLLNPEERAQIFPIRSDNGMLHIHRRHTFHRPKDTTHNRFPGAKKCLDLFLAADIRALNRTILGRLHEEHHPLGAGGLVGQRKSNGHV